MKTDSARQIVLSYLDSYHEGDLEKTVAFCADDIDFIAYAPVTIFPHSDNGAARPHSLKPYRRAQAVIHRCAATC